MKEIIRAFNANINTISEKALDDVQVLKDAIILTPNGSKTIVGNCDHGILTMIKHAKEQLRIKSKMSIVRRVYLMPSPMNIEAFADRFELTYEDADRINSLLNECFDQSGVFLKKRFESRVSDLVPFEKSIFEILWGYLKTIQKRRDRVSFLNALQLIITRINQPKLVLKFLLEDILSRPWTVSASERNAFMLINLLLRKYNKELNINIEHTPEEVLKVKEGLDQEAIQYTSGLIEADKDRFIKKVKTIHNHITSLLDPASTANIPLPIGHMLHLEREVLIFLSLLSGNISRLVIRSAVTEYGIPESGVYKYEGAADHMPLLMHNLRIALLGLNRVGERIDIPLLDRIIAGKDRFVFVEQTRGNDRLLEGTMKLVDMVKKSLGKEINYADQE